LGPTPRTTTFVVVPDFRVRFQTTMSSDAASGVPSVARAISGWLETAAATSRSRMLMSSAVDPFRITIAFCGDPVLVSAAWKPPERASVKMKTHATRAMPSAVSAVLTRRAARLRRL
jgi:hypothetical protein